MSTSNEELLIKVSADTNTAIKEINRLNKEVGTLTKQVDKSKTSTARQKKSFDDLSKSTNKLSGLLGKVTLGLGAMGVAMKAVEFTKLAADAEQSGDAFEKVVTDMGMVADEEFEKIKTASEGLISDAAIKQSATTAISLGVPLEKLAGLMEVARAKSREMGTDAKKAFEDLATGIGRGSPMILDNLGLTIKLGEANQKYAASIGKTVAELSKEEKQLALTNAVLEAGAASVERFKDAGLSSKQSIAQMTASLDNLKVKIGNQLLPIMLNFAETTSEFLESIDDDAIEGFGDSIKTLVSALTGLVSVAKTLNDVFAPDAWFGDDAGVISLFLHGLKSLEWATSRLYKRFDEANGALEKLTNQQSDVDGLSTAVQRFAGDSVSEFNALQVAIGDVMDANSAQIEEWNKSDPEIYADKIKTLSSENDKLLKLYEKLVNKRPYQPQVDSAKEAEYAVKGLTDATAKYTEDQAKDLKKFYEGRVKDHSASLKKLTSEESKLASDVIKINEKLAKTLKGIDDARFKSNFDTNQKIKELEISLLPKTKQYAALEKQEAQALADAKVALKEGEYEKYKAYLAEYERLALTSSDKITKEHGSVAASEKQTAEAKIKILKDVQSLENAYFDKQASDAKSAHDSLVAQKKIEIELVKQRLEGEKAVILAMKQFIEATTGKAVDLDMTAIDNAINGIAKLNGDLVLLGTTPTPIQTDTTSLDAAKEKMEEVKTLTLNGVTLEVDADTTAADFDIDKLITKKDGDEISMDVNPAYEKAEKELDTFRKDQEKDPIEKPLDIDTETAKKKLDILVTDMEKPTDSEHTVEDNVPDILQEIEKLKVTTYSDHYITEHVTPARAGGGLVPQRLAVGGTFRGSGKVPGYDASDSDNVNAYLTGGEYVINRAAVDNIGISALNAINSFKMPNLPGYADGGLVGPSTSTSSSPPLQPVVINIGNSSLTAQMTPEMVMEALTLGLDSKGGF